MDDKKREEIALFRYGLISQVLNQAVEGQMKYFREIAAKEYDVPNQGRRKYRVSAFKSWLKKYRKHGFDGLKPKHRSDAGQSRKIDEGLKAGIEEILQRHPFLSSATLFRILLAEGKILPGELTEATVRKFIKDKGLGKLSEPTPRKKFEKEHLNELCIADSLHGPSIVVGGKKYKTYLIAIIDDRTRVITGAKFFFNENTINLGIVLKEAILKFGLPKVLYCDNGSLFTSNHLQLACAQLGIALVHSKPYDSPSRGKIERFFRTTRQKFFPTLDLSEIQCLDDLNDHFLAWLDSQYHREFHHGIQAKPLDRLMDELRLVNIKRISEHELDSAFLITIERVVKNDSTVSINNILYECPPTFIGKKVQIRFPSDDPENLSIYVNNSPVAKLHKLNLHENANIPAYSIHFNKKKENQND